MESSLLRRTLYAAPLCTLIALSTLIALTGCAIDPPTIESRALPVAPAFQAVAASSTAPVLKRKIALGRITNETSYGRSLLRDEANDALGQQISDMLAKALTESGAYVVLERPDIGRVEAERQLSGITQPLVGVDALIMGSLSEFGRQTVGKHGFVTATKKQLASARIDLRLVDVTTGHSFFSASGAGEASTEATTTFGFGSHAAYDSTLNDASIRQAVASVVERLNRELAARPWQTAILSAKQGSYYIAGGKSQGIRPGMLFSVQAEGRKIKSPQTGFTVTLPGRELAQIRIESLFGADDTSEGAIASLVSGSLNGASLDQLVVRERSAR